MVVLSGSVPAGVPVDIYGQLIEACHSAGRKVCLDASGELLWEGVRAKPDIVKPNERELEYLAGKIRAGDVLTEQVSANPISVDKPLAPGVPIGYHMLAAEARKLVSAGIGKVVLSMGAEGLLYVDHGQELYQAAKQEIGRAHV